MQKIRSDHYMAIVKAACMFKKCWYGQKETEIIDALPLIKL